MTTTTPLPLGRALDEARFTSLHRRFWLLAALGILLDGFDFFIIGVANPLIAEQFDASDWQKGLVSAAAIVGSIVGAAGLGPLGDKLGRRRIFKYDLIVFVVFSVLCMLAWDLWSLIAFRFALGIAVGLDYPIAASYLAEILPRRSRGRGLVAAFSLQAVGMLLGAVVGVVVLSLAPSVTSWRWMLGFGVVPALVIIWLRRSTPESPRWLAQNGQEEQACAIAERLVGAPVVVTEEDRARSEPPPEGLRALVQPQLFSRAMRRRTVFASVPWFLMDLATYGVGIFTPTLLAAMALAGPDATFIADDIASTEGTAVLDVFLVLGFVSAILTVERIGRVRLQVVGFAFMALGLLVLAGASALPGGGNEHLALVFVGFAVFNFWMNAGPNATTYALPAEIFPSEVRAAGHGFAAGAAKLGAALGVFLFPILLDDIGQPALLTVLAVACTAALVVTVVLRVEPAGKSLDEISGQDAVAMRARPTPP